MESRLKFGAGARAVMGGARQAACHSHNYNECSGSGSPQRKQVLHCHHNRNPKRRSIDKALPISQQELGWLLDDAVAGIRSNADASLRETSWRSLQAEVQGMRAEQMAQWRVALRASLQDLEVHAAVCNLPLSRPPHCARCLAWT